MERYIATQFYKADSPESRILGESGLVPSEFVLAADAQRALDAEREKVKELVANQAEYEKCTDEQITALNQGCLDYEKQIATLQAQLAALRHDYAQLKEAYDAKESGVPLGPVVGAQTIVNQQREINRLQAQLRQVEEALQERKEFIADCDTALDRIQAPRTNEGQEELVSTWRRIELLGKLLYQYRQELERSAPTLRAENARLKAAICDIWNGHGLCEDHGQLGYWKLGKYIDLAIALQPERGTP